MNFQRGQNLKLEDFAILLLFFIVLQACSPGDTYSVSKESINLSANSGGDSVTPAPNPNSSPPSASPTPTPTPTPPPAASPTPTPTPPSSGPTTDYCPSTPVRLSINASEPYHKIYSSNYADTPPGGSFVVAIYVTAADTTVGRYLAEIGYSDFGPTRSGRYVTLSKSKCDYSDSAQWISVNVGGVKLADNAGGGTVSMGPESRPASAVLTPGLWYLNVQNAPGACPPYVTTCDVVLTWAN